MFDKKWTLGVSGRDYTPPLLKNCMSQQKNAQRGAEY